MPVPESAAVANVQHSASPQPVSSAVGAQARAAPEAQLAVGDETSGAAAPAFVMAPAAPVPAASAPAAAHVIVDAGAGALTKLSLVAQAGIVLPGPDGFFPCAS